MYDHLLHTYLSYMFHCNCKIINYLFCFICLLILCLQVSVDDIASPAELAKAYMGSRSSKLSPSMLGLRSSPREDPTLLKSQNFAQKSPIMSIVPRTTTLTRVHENGFVTPRSRGRSAIYNMARTPYSRVHPGSLPKVCPFTE